MSLKLKRFTDAKQAQVEQLIGYARLMGLSGTDLVSIGGKLQREESKSKKLENLKIVAGFECLPVGRDSKYNLDARFKLKTTDGSYRFLRQGYEGWRIHSSKTGLYQEVRVNYSEYELGRIGYYTKVRYAVLLDIAAGKIHLNF